MSFENLFHYELHKLILSLVRLQWSLAFCFGEVRSVDRDIIRGMDRRYLHISYLDYVELKKSRDLLAESKPLETVRRIIIIGMCTCSLVIKHHPAPLIISGSLTKFLRIIHGVWMTLWAPR